MERPRLPLRSMVIVLAALAALGYILICRSAEFAEKAYEHKTNMDLLETVAATHLGFMPKWVPAAERARLARQPDHPWHPLEATFARWEKFVLYEDQMYSKYSRAARFPWLPVGPDPEAPYPRYSDTGSYHGSMEHSVRASELFPSAKTNSHE
jgi:hypothetical protein